MPERLILFLLFFPAFLFALSFHESAHGWVALRLGDDTAKRLGRITLNPIPHIDLFGTILLPLFLFLTPGIRVPIGGWAKPVPVDTRNFRRPRQDNLWVALAGPLSNLLLALLCAACLQGIVWVLPQMEAALQQSRPLKITAGAVYSVFELSVWINLGLAFFNLIPLHPLDGGKVVEGLLPEAWIASYNRVAGYGFLIIFALFYFGAFKFLYGPVKYLAEILIPA